MLPAARWIGVGAALLIGLVRGWHLWWTTDDAFISFRYARNLVGGLGLVFNAGERVEGYTNPLWTLWIAAGLAAGADAEVWANGWGLAAYGGSIALLGFNGLLAWRAGASWNLVPLVAAWGACAHRDWAVYATSGLETSALTFLVLAGWTLAVWNLERPWWLGAAGVVLALGSLTRPDGVLPAVVVGLAVLAWSRPRSRGTWLYGLGFMAIWLPFTLWRVAYYGDLFPNTYYAKSAYLSWYSQGLAYLGPYLARYWVLAIGPLVAAIAFALQPPRDRDADSASSRQLGRMALSAGAIAAVYIFYVVRLGGDFMHARMLIPATPFLLLVLAVGLMRAVGSRPVVGTALALAVPAAMVLSPSPFEGDEFRQGVADEWRHYRPSEVEKVDRLAASLAPYFDGLPVRVAFHGGEARLVYRAGFAVGIECSTGLTEPAIARQPLEERGRPGHEKPPTALYLVEQRRAHFTFSKVPGEQFRLIEFIPRYLVQFDDGVYGQVLHWDPAIMDALHARGARLGNLPWVLDTALERMARLPREERAEYFGRFERFYFRYAADPQREAAFGALLGE